MKELDKNKRKQCTKIRNFGEAMDYEKRKKEKKNILNQKKV